MRQRGKDAPTLPLRDPRGNRGNPQALHRGVGIPKERKRGGDQVKRLNKVFTAKTPRRQDGKINVGVKLERNRLETNKTIKRGLPTKSRNSRESPKVVVAGL